MTLVSLVDGFPFPPNAFYTAGGSGGSSKTLDATGEQCCIVGHIMTEGKASKTISAAGGGSIVWRSASPITWTATGPASTLVVSIQDVDTASGPVARGDGTDDVSKTLTSGVDAISANTWITCVMDAGSKTVAHGDLIAINWNLSARNGSDSVLIGTGSVPIPARPVPNVYLAGTWGTATQSELPGFYIVFDDGTVGTMYVRNMFLPATSSSESFADSNNPDERGTLFQVPFDCNIDGFCGIFGGSAAGADFTLKLYSDPLGTPTLIASLSVLAEQVNTSANRIGMYLLGSEYSLSKNTDYAIALLATGAGSVSLGLITLPTTDLRAMLANGTTLKKVTRNNSTGAFAAESPAVTMYNLGVLVSQIHDGSGSGGGMLQGNLRGNMQ